jgi:hypothetical protein
VTSETALLNPRVVSSRTGADAYLLLPLGLMSETLATLPSSYEPGADDRQAFKGGIYAFLDSLPPSTLSRLYQSPSSCLAIFRLLPEIARHVVTDMLWYSGEVTRADLDDRFRGREGKRSVPFPCRVAAPCK